MSRAHVTVLGAAALWAAVGCTKTNPIYCEAASDCDPGWKCDLIAHECEFDGRDAGDGTGCTMSAACPATTPICSPSRECVTCASGDECADRDPDRPLCTSSGTCAECESDGDCDSPTADFCDTATGTCRGCLSDDECASEVCDRDLGSCADPGGIIYVDNDGGVDDADCGSQSSPCESLSDTEGALAKVAAGRRTIKVRPGAGGYPEAIALDGQAVVISGAGATLRPVVIDTPAVSVTGGANVTIVGLTVTGAAGGTAADGIHCAGDASIVRLIGALVEGNADLGVDAEAPCDVRILRSVVRLNDGGGVRVGGDSFAIANSMIVDNGGGTAQVGGVHLAGTGSAATQRFELNTVAGNQKAGGGLAGGVHCGAAIAGSSSILWGNTGAQSDGQCSWAYSDVEGGAAGDGNLDEDPLFAGVDDYHLMDESPCVDAADPSASLGIDVDGEDRPAGGRSDMGADETTGGGS